MTMYEYQPDFEPFLIKVKGNDSIGCKLGLQAINIIENDEFNWFVKDGGRWVTASIFFGKKSVNEFHFITNQIEPISTWIRIEVVRNGVALKKERQIIITAIDKVDEFWKEQWSLRVGGFMYHRIRLDGNDAKFNQSNLEINKTPFVLDTKPITVFPLIKSKAQLLLEDICGGG